MSGCILAIETSTPRGGVAVLEAGQLRFEQSFSSERSHNSQLFAPLREALEVCGGRLRLIVVGTGPASYTGSRIGIASAQGIALARGVPVIGLPSVLAVDTEAAHHFVCGDARRGVFFLAEIRGGRLAHEIETMDAGTFRARHEAQHAQAPWFTFDAKAPLALPGMACVGPDAARLAERASALSQEETARLAQQPLEPVYLSAPFVTLPR